MSFDPFCYAANKLTTRVTKENIILELDGFVDNVYEEAINEQRLTAGKTYKVKLSNGSANAEVECVAKKMPWGDGEAIYLGNLALVEMGDDTGDSYFIGIIHEGGIYVVYAATNDSSDVTSATVSTTVTVKVIDPKYLPNNVINIQDHGFESMQTYLTMAMTGGNGHIADIEVHGFWEKVDDIQQDGCNFIWITDNEGDCLCMIPTECKLTANLSNVQWISFVPTVDTYVNAKVNFNRLSYGYGAVRISMWLELLPKT